MRLREVERYGYEGGTSVSPVDVPFPNRALAPRTDKKPYTIYEVVKPVEVQTGKIAPWFHESGGGIQHEFSKPISKLNGKGLRVAKSANGSLTRYLYEYLRFINIKATENFSVALILIIRDR